MHFASLKINYSFSKVTCSSRRIMFTKLHKGANLYFEAKTRCNFQLGKMREKVRLKFEVIWYFIVRDMLVCILLVDDRWSLKYVGGIKELYLFMCGPGSSVGIATELRAGRSGIESRWGRDVPPVLTCPGTHLGSCKMGTESFPGVDCGRSVGLTAHPLLVPRSWKSRAIPLPTLWATPAL